MALTPDVRLGPYEIQSPLGAGGMGEVYRARDTRLDRTVAVKILPEHLSEAPEAKERFAREARAISSLSHPNICHLYDVGEQDGISYLVMEYLEGETLADRLRKGPLSLAQVLKVGAEICDGLEKAHRNGVVHRDLKPSNIMLTKSGAKLMDFGLAKTPVPAAAAGSSDSLATMSRPLTVQGTIVGTYQYMSPEQVEGKEADPRSDIFSVGAVLYEMVTGKRAFEGKTTASTIAAILAADPKPISSIQPMSPPALEHVTKVCLAKDPDERLQTAHDVKVELQWIAQTISSTAVPASPIARRVYREYLAWLLVLLLLLAVVGEGVNRWVRAHQTQSAMYFNSPVPFAANDVALSPDGRMVALVGYSEQTNNYVIWKYEVGGRSAVVIAGTEAASHPFWSPDGRSIGFFAGGKLKKVDAFSGNSPQVLCDAPTGRGGTWNRDGVILFAPDVFGGIYRVSSGGGPPVEVTKPDPSRSETSHRWPVFLPDGRHFLYLAANFSGEFDKNAIVVGSLESTEKRLVVSSNSNPAYADGYLFYLRDKALMAQRFDLRSYSLSAEPYIVIDGVQYFPQIDLALFGAANNGILVAQLGKGAVRSQLMWFDRRGKGIGAVGSPGLFANPALSPDGRRVAVDQTDTDGRHIDIWIYQISNHAAARLTFGPVLNDLPVWSPDSKRVAFGSNRKLGWSLLEKNADGSGSELEFNLRSDKTQHPRDWSRDGKYLLVWRNGELWYVSVPEQEARPLFQAKWTVRNAQFSPDGKWVAYSSNESGSWEVYVAPFPSGSSKWQISRGGGEEPRWRRDGKELFYLSTDGKMTAVPVKTGDDFEAGAPVTLFQTHLAQPIQGPDVVSYDVTGDGQRFLINTKVDDPNAAPLAVIVNWRSQVEK